MYLVMLNLLQNGSFYFLIFSFAFYQSFHNLNHQFPFYNIFLHYLQTLEN